MTNAQKLHVAFDQLFCYGNNVGVEISVADSWRHPVN